jgi:hypothetical protein
LADHFERGGVRDRAASWYRQAASQALEAGSLPDVVRSGERALACGAQGELLGEVASVVAEALSYGGNPSGVTQWAATARTHLPAGSAAWWRASQVLTIASLQQGSGTAAELVSQMIEMGELPDSQSERVVALGYVAANSFLSTTPELGLGILARLPEQLPEAQRGRPEGSVLCARVMLALSQDLAAAGRYACASLEAFRSAGAVRDVAEMLHVAGCVLRELGEHSASERFSLELVELGQRLGVRRWICHGQQNLGIIELERGELAKAKKSLGESADGYGALGMHAAQAFSLFHLAVATAEQGDRQVIARNPSQVHARTADSFGAAGQALQLLRTH